MGGAARAMALPTFEGKACNERSEFIWPSRHAQTSLASQQVQSIVEDGLTSVECSWLNERRVSLRIS